MQRRALQIAISIPLFFTLACTVETLDGATGDYSGDLEAAPGSGSYDVVVVGAGTGGVTASIQAARLGADVALVERTDWVGGQMTSAAVACLDGIRYGQARRNGIVAEWVQRIEDYYQHRAPHAPKSVQTGMRLGSVCAEPSVAQRVLREMLDEAGVTLITAAAVDRVLTTGRTVTGAVLSNGDTLSSEVLIDATEHGDVIPLTPARYRVGNQISDRSIDPNACIQDLTYTAVIQRYPGGVPNELRLNSKPPGYDDVRARFSQFVARSGSDVFTERPWSWRRHNAYRGTPDSSNPQSYTAIDLSRITKTVVNMANDFPGTATGRPGRGTGPQLSLSYLEDPETRRDVDCRAKLLTLNFLYYMQHELGESQWSVADEGYDTRYNRRDNDCPDIPEEFKAIERQMPAMPYVRESRRIVPIRTLTGRDIFRDPTTRRAVHNFPTAVAIGHYATDLHNCGSESDLDVGDTTDVYQEWPSVERGGHAVVGPFQVPFEAMIPETVDGFLAAEKNIGVSRVVNGATRLHPITMLTGQAAGTIAALAIRQGVQPRELRPVDVQQELLRAGSAISLYDYTDVPRSHTFWRAVQLTSANEVMVGIGEGRFGVRDSITREQAAVVLTRLFDLPTKPVCDPTFSDVAATRWSCRHVEALRAAGVTSGCGGNRFCPDQPMTRAQLAVLMVNGLGMVPPAASSSRFTDVADGHWSYNHIQLAAQLGLFHGCGANRFCPDRIATRGETAAVAARVLSR